MEHVYKVIELLSRIYPDGIDDEDYPAIVAILQKDISEQNLSALLSYVTGKEVILVQKDISLYQEHAIPSNVLEKLTQAGYSLIA